MAVSTDTRRLQRKFNELLRQVNDRETFLELGFFVIKTIRNRTRDQGRGVARPGGNERRLKSVSQEWAERRVKFRRHPKAATGRRSNLTFKGTMLDSMIVKRADKNAIIIGFRTREQEEKAEGQTEQGRPFMNLSRKEIRNSTEFLKELILR